MKKNCYNDLKCTPRKAKSPLSVYCVYKLFVHHEGHKDVIAR